MVEKVGLLTGETFIIVGLWNVHADNFFLVSRTRKACALNRLGTAIIERFQTLLPGRPMQHVEVPLVDVGGQEDVQRLRLADIRRAVARQFDNPALIELKGGLEDALFMLVEAFQMLNRPLVLKDRGPDFLGIGALGVEQTLKLWVFHGE